jgi:hypothetical protein
MHYCVTFYLWSSCGNYYSGIYQFLLIFTGVWVIFSVVTRHILRPVCRVYFAGVLAAETERWSTQNFCFDATIFISVSSRVCCSSERNNYGHTMVREYTSLFLWFRIVKCYWSATSKITPWELHFCKSCASPLWRNKRFSAMFSGNHCWVPISCATWTSIVFLIRCYFRLSATRFPRWAPSESFWMKIVCVYVEFFDACYLLIQFPAWLFQPWSVKQRVRRCCA